MPAIGSSSSSKPRLGGERHRELELAVLAVAELATTVSARAARPTRRERRTRGLAQFALAPGAAPKAERVAGVRLHGQRDIVERGEIAEQRGDLERARQPQQAAAMDRPRGDVGAVEEDAAGVRRDFAGELADQRGLAGAVRTDDRVQLPGLTSSMMSSEATTPPKRLVRPSIASSASATAIAPKSPSMPPRL